MKKEVEARRTIIDLYNIFHNKLDIDEVTNALVNEYRKLFYIVNHECGVEVSSCKFQVYAGYGTDQIELMFYRMETDEEYDKRISREKKKKDVLEKKRLDKEKKERAEYERLKKKFG